mmetsp:Transcript_26736/g.41834  ORF Transcript_26736/g.41834 Transcript_26736/m.41834 type:complete len:309 (+) Transcript_26736:1308-2234(+)
MVPASKNINHNPIVDAVQCHAHQSAKHELRRSNLTQKHSIGNLDWHGGQESFHHGGISHDNRLLKIHLADGQEGMVGLVRQLGAHAPILRDRVPELASARLTPLNLRKFAGDLVSIEIRDAGLVLFASPNLNQQVPAVDVVNDLHPEDAPLRGHCGLQQPEGHGAVPELPKERILQGEPEVHVCCDLHEVFILELQDPLLQPIALSAICLRPKNVEPWGVALEGDHRLSLSHHRTTWLSKPRIRGHIRVLGVLLMADINDNEDSDQQDLQQRIDCNMRGGLARDHFLLLVRLVLLPPRWPLPPLEMLL